MKIKEYITIHGSNLEILDIRINEKIELGFQPIGGPTFNFFIENAYPENEFNDLYGVKMVPGFKQAMVRYDESTELTQPYSINPKEKERKIVDCFAADLICPNNVYYCEKKALDRNEGWETIYKSDSELKMVKYEI